MKPTKFLSVIFLLVMSIACVEASYSIKRDNQKLNFLFIISDDLNDWLIRKEEFPYIKTPNIDKLASESINFTNAYCNAPLCNPSRTSFLTGRLPSNSGIYAFPNDYKNFINKFLVKNKKINTMPKLFAKNGYTTYGVGKVFHYITNQKYQFDFYGNYHLLKDSKFFFSKYRTNQYMVLDEPYTLSDAKKVDWALDQFNNNLQEPFFMAVGFNYPHLPWIIPRKFWDLYDEDDISLEHISEQEFSNKLRKYLKKEIKRHNVFKDNYKELIHAYLATVSYLDEQIGRLLAYVENSPYAQNTVIVFTSDHGYHLGEKSLIGKRTLWERANHIPFLMKVPDKMATTNDTLVSLIDLYPTLLGLANIEAPKNLDGKDIFAQEEDSSENLTVSTMYFNRHALRYQNWRFISYRGKELELYDLDFDPEEKNNLAYLPEYQDLVKSFKQKLPKKNINSFGKNTASISANNTLLAFDEHEVTNADFAKFVKDTKLQKKHQGSMLFDESNAKWKFDKNSSWDQPFGKNSSIAGIEDHPVVHLDFFQASAYCHSKNKRLPRFSEWKAFAGNVKVQSADGTWLANVFQGDFPHNNTALDGFSGTAPVKSFAANDYGLYDMTGNVWEWVLDDKNQEAYMVGGSFLCDTNCHGLQKLNLVKNKKSYSSSHLGFRCIADLEEELD